jgi:oligopeptide/dipeptide ABC transporter ATP-binding protein
VTVEASLSGTDRPQTGEVILEVQDLKKYFVQRSGFLEKTALKAVDGVNLTLRAGQTVGLVGESGSGKTTVGRTIVRLYRPTGGKILFRGKDISHSSENELLEVRRHIQMVFQDPFASLNPRMKVRDIVGEPLITHGMWERVGGERRVSELLELVGLSIRYADRYPHEFSGGQRQRIGIARALALNPQVLILDEPVSALDVSIQAQIVNLLQELQDEFRLAYLFIAHDLSVIRHISDSVAVMYLGRIVEDGPKQDIFRRASHPYTQALLSSVPIPDPDSTQRRRRIVLEGDLPNPAKPPSGCRFRTRCPIATERCAIESPELVQRPGVPHPVACHFAEPKNMLT